MIDKNEIDEINKNCRKEYRRKEWINIFLAHHKFSK